MDNFLNNVMSLSMLPSDIIIWLLFVSFIIYSIYVFKTPLLKQSWQRVFKKPISAITIVPMMVFFSIALLDSIRITQSIAPNTPKQTASIEQKTLLDTFIAPVILGKEKTYSAPLDYLSFAKENLVQEGIRKRDYPLLIHAGKHLQDPAKSHSADLLYRSYLWLIASIVSLSALLSLCALIQTITSKISFITSVKHIVQGRCDYPFRAFILSTSFVISIIIGFFIFSPFYHLMGTDKVGQDIFYLSLKSIRTACLIGSLTTIIVMPIGVILGLVAGYFRGWIDDVIQYIYTTLNSIPDILLIAASVLFLQIYISANPETFSTVELRADVRLLFLCLILGLTSWTGICRLIRAETLKLREQEYVQAARAFGGNSLQIMFKHIFPNLMHIVLITTVMDFSGTILSESVLSYIGVGVDPSMNSFGNMINQARSELARDPIIWWPLASAFIFLFTLVLIINLFAEQVRDAFDPRLQVFKK